ncbi:MULTISPECIES: aminotransferase class III-fold pyridoxal phosphate-dependent enzyme [unclassified Streptomyces]|uniref:aminotransferase class III-fold pyridoxal phosphate-dependent enzyme n=1 Tax=unclassified Streptomyces TaxID=2593676 RepID=UPI00035FCA7F|nr:MULTISPECIES: aminotransferase class III-fold pyridoxal phosphate-dependent enzyme [unclassified Streptomyces]MYT30238.1 aminotransferase class III-fold pyridoxal phosphate-dependent enzyme [Streptomyces sp. SID8354]
MSTTSAFTEFVQPQMGRVLTALGLDVEYERAEGNTLYHRDDQGEQVPVLDLMGGYGSLILGHNHPEIVAHARELLDQNRAVHAQFSLRGEAGRLGAALSDVVRRETGIKEPYLATFGNSGAEAVESAVKHAELVRVRAAMALAEEVAAHVAAARDAVRRGAATVDPDAYRLPALQGQAAPAAGIEGLLAAVGAHNAAALATKPLFLALERSFHGKLVGSVQLTYNAGFRAPFQNLGTRVRFVPMDRPELLAEIAEDERVVLLDTELADGRVRVVERDFPAITAFLVEPVQGEGGIHALTAEQGRAIRLFCNKVGTALIIDEVQSGMGRCGAFLASSLIGLRGDYYTLSKSLGGGLAKVSAMLVRRSLYQGEFDLIHSSTFAMDDFSSSIARKVVEMLEADDGKVYRQVTERGERLVEMLADLKSAYPDVIEDIRGKGLFVGVQLREQGEARSMVLRGSAYTGALGYLLSGYLLRQERIRIAPTGSAGNVLRIQPSAYLTDEEIERLRGALDRLCRILRYEDTLHLVHPASDRTIPKPRAEIRDFRGAIEGYEQPAPRPVTGPVRKVAFVNHLITPAHLRQVDPALADLSDAALRSFVLGMDPVKKAAPYPGVRIDSPLGSAVEFALYPLMVGSEQMGGYLASGDVAGIRADVEERVQAAREDGCEVAGLGMYTSIVTNNCTSLNVPGIALTSGNALTVAMGVQAMEHGARDRGFAVGDATLAVVGAAGNIASVYSQLFAEQLSRIVLVGSRRDGSARRLRTTVHGIYQEAWARIVEGGELAGIPARLAEEPLIAKWLADGPSAEVPADADRGKEIAAYLEERYGQDPFLTVTQDTEALHKAQLVLCASNSPEPFLTGEHFAPDAVVCDIAVPNNAVPDLAARRPDLAYMLGGIVATPNGESLHPSARAFLEAGQLFACMAETALMGLAGIDRHYSYGNITRRQVIDIAALADAHGLRLADYKSAHSV